MAIAMNAGSHNVIAHQTVLVHVCATISTPMPLIFIAFLRSSMIDLKEGGGSLFSGSEGGSGASLSNDHISNVPTNPTTAIVMNMTCQLDISTRGMRRTDDSILAISIEL